MTPLLWLLTHGRARWTTSQLGVAVAASVVGGGLLQLGGDVVGSAVLVLLLVLGVLRLGTPRTTASSPSAAMWAMAVVVDLVGVGGLWASWMPDVQGSWLPPSWPHLLGTDAVGHDVLQQLMRAGRVSLVVAVGAGFFSACLGCAAGVVAGLRGGAVDAVVMRLSDGVMSLPLLPLLLVLAAVPPEAWQSLSTWSWPLLVLSAGLLATSLKRSAAGVLVGVGLLLTGVALAALSTTGSSADVVRLVVLLSAFAWVRTARLVRTQVQQLVHSEWWQASRALGADDRQRLRTLVWPHVQDVVWASFALDVAGAFVAEAALSYLGLGLSPPTTSWGRMLLGALQTLQQHPHVVVLPVLCVLGVSWLLHRLAEDIRTSLDPGSI